MSDLQLSIAENSLSRQLDWVRAADTKIPPLFAINVAMLTVLVSQQLSIDARGGWVVFCALVAVVLIVISIFFLAYAAVPKFGKPGPSVVYFGGISEMGRERFLEIMSRSDSSEYITELHVQAFKNAEIANKRYRAITRSYRYAFSALPFWLAGMIGAFT